MEPARDSDLRRHSSGHGHARTDNDSEYKNRFGDRFHYSGHQERTHGGEKRSGDQRETDAEFIDGPGHEGARQTSHQAEDGKGEAQFFAVQVHGLSHVSIDDAGAKGGKRKIQNHDHPKDDQKLPPVERFLLHGPPNARPRASVATPAEMQDRARSGRIISPRRTHVNLHKFGRPYRAGMGKIGWNGLLAVGDEEKQSQDNNRNQGQRNVAPGKMSKASVRPWLRTAAAVGDSDLVLMFE